MKAGSRKPRPMLRTRGRQLLDGWIKRSHLTQDQAAELIGFGRVTLNQYLNGAVRPSLETAALIETATGIGMRTWLMKEWLTEDQTAGTNGTVVNGVREAVAGW